jgi:hypothetical protein
MAASCRRCCGGWQPVDQEHQRYAQEFEQTIADVYLREAGRLRAIIQSDAPRAVATLRHMVEVLRAYTGAGMVAQGDRGLSAAQIGALVHKAAELPTLHLSLLTRCWMGCTSPSSPAFWKKANHNKLGQARWESVGVR